jgi:hypothetical protein
MGTKNLWLGKQTISCENKINGQNNKYLGNEVITM